MRSFGYVRRPEPGKIVQNTFDGPAGSPSLPPGPRSRPQESSRQPSGKSGRKPDSRSTSDVQRSAPCPARKALCITFSPPKAKPNSAEVNRPMSRGAFSSLRVAARSFRRPSSAPSIASTSKAARPATTCARTFSNPLTRSPALRATPSPASSRASSRDSTRSARFAGAVTFALAARAKRPLRAAVSHRSAVGGYPQAPARQLASDIRRHLAFRPGHEPDQTRFAHHLAGDDIPTLA